MSQSSRQSRRDAARQRERTAHRPGWLVPILAVAVVVLVAGAAIVLGGNAATDSASPSPAASASGGGVGEAPVITGQSLEPFDPATVDPAVGQPTPTVAGVSFDGSRVTVGGAGRPSILVFLAHWCSHCQAEVPVVQAWLDGGGLPDGVDLVSISTATDPAAPNYPPEVWLDREGWTPPVIVDPSGSIATAFGLSAFPYFVYVNADGTVAGRVTGEVPITDLQAVADLLAAGG